MPLPLATPDNALLRIRVVYSGVPHPVQPTSAGDLALTRERPEETAFYLRDKLSGGPLKFTGRDFALLNAINRSSARCQPLGLVVEHRGAPDLDWETWTGSFTCNDCTDWNEAACSVSLTPSLADPYQKLLDNYDKPYNILLAAPGKPRVPVTAELVSLAAGISIEFLPVSMDEEPDYLGNDGWSLFLQNRAWIEGTGAGGLRSDIDIIFRYRLRNVPMIPNGVGGYTPVDKSAGGWQVLQTTFNGTTGTVDYVKTPGIAGFKTYKIGTYNDWNDPRNPARNSRYADALLLIDADKQPSDYGYKNTEYIELTGSGGFNSPADECPSGQTVRIRRTVDDEQCSRLFWKFGSFRFGRCFRLIDGLYSLLLQTAAPYGGLALLPPTPEQLSEFLTAETNYATGDFGAANELPRLQLSAGSDVKRYGSSEAATRLLISLKEFLEDLSALWDAGWFIDPATGWLRFEHRSWAESRRSGTVDLRTFEDAVLSNAYAFRVQQLPRYEDLIVSNALTEDLANEAYFTKASLDYGLGSCVSQREGQNRVSYQVNRLTGDVAAGVLSSDTIPDNALFILAPNTLSQLPQANRELACSQLLLRYYTHGRPAATATVEGPAPLTAPNTVTGALPVSGVPANIVSVKPPRVQVSPIAGKVRYFADLTPEAAYITNLGEGGELGKAELNLRTRMLKATVWLPGFDTLTDAPDPGGKQFDESFPDSFN